MQDYQAEVTNKKGKEKMPATARIKSGQIE